MPLSKTLLDAVDLHIVGITAMLLVLAAILPFAWTPWLVAVVPLGRLATRFADLGRSGRARWPHLLVNGAVIAAMTALALLLSPAA